jgi:type II secretory pathway component PulF
MPLFNVRFRLPWKAVEKTRAAEEASATFLTSLKRLFLIEVPGSDAAVAGTRRFLGALIRTGSVLVRAGASDEARRLIESAGVRVTGVRTWHESGYAPETRDLEQVYSLIQRLIRLLERGLPLDEGLRDFRGSLPFGPIAVVLDVLLSEIASGADLLDTMRRFPQVFAPEVLLALEHAQDGASAARDIQQHLRHVSLYREFHSAMFAAFPYFVVVAGLAALVGIQHHSAVLPVFQEMLHQMGTMSFGQSLIPAWPLTSRGPLLLGAFLAFGLLAGALAWYSDGRWFGWLFQPWRAGVMERYRLARHLATLDRRGRLTLENLASLVPYCRQREMREALAVAVEEVRQGRPLHEALEAAPALGFEVQLAAKAARFGGSLHRVLESGFPAFEGYFGLWPRRVRNYQLVLYLLTGLLAGIVVVTVYGNIYHLVSGLIAF